MKDPKTRHFYLSFLLAFILPIYKDGATLCVILMALNWLLLGKKAFSIDNLKSNIFLLLLLGFYFWHLAGMLWTSNLYFGLFDLEIKLTFLILPLVFSAFGRFKIYRFERILKGYLLGCSVAIIYGIVNSLWAYVSGADLYLDLYNDNITPLLHISYFAMYLNLALVICFYLIVRNENDLYSWRNVGLIVLSFVFALATFFSTSRNGFLALIFILVIVSVYAIIRYKKWLVGISVVLIIWIVASSLLKDINLGTRSFHGFNKVTDVIKNSNVKEDATESTAVRVLVWKSTLSLIKNNPLLGVGTGDIKDELKAEYKLNGYVEPVKKNYNAHNQFLQSFAALGIIGMLLLLAIFTYPALVSFQKNNYLYLMFIINIAVSCLTESILEVQAGVVFFTFFTSLFTPILMASSTRKINVI